MYRNETTPGALLFIPVPGMGKFPRTLPPLLYS